MNGYEQFLVVTLSTFLAISLILTIVLLVLVIKLVKTVRRITEKAEHLADKADAVGDFFKHAAGPVSLGRAIATVVENVIRTKKSKKG